MHTRGSVKIGAETMLGMLYEYQLACFATTVSPLLFHKYPLGTKLHVCFSPQSDASYRQVLLMIFRLSVFSPPWLVLSLSNCRSPFMVLSSLCVSIFHAIYLSRPPCFSLRLSISFLTCAFIFFSLCAPPPSTFQSCSEIRAFVWVTVSLCLFFLLCTWKEGCQCGVVHCSELWV